MERDIMRKAISGVLVIAMMMSTFGASNVQAASINSGSDYVEENGVVVEASATDAEDIEDNGDVDDTQEVVTDNRQRTKGNLDSIDQVNVDEYTFIRQDDESSPVVLNIVVQRLQIGLIIQSS